MLKKIYNSVKISVKIECQICDMVFIKLEWKLKLIIVKKLK